MTFLAAYLIFLVIFGIVDLIWLSTMAGRLYRPALGDLLLERVRKAPALLFYFGFPAGIVHFAVMPALAMASPTAAFVNGALLGLLSYATYDLTNYATLRVWTLKLTIADLVYGTLVSGGAALGAYGGVRWLMGAGWI